MSVLPCTDDANPPTSPVVTNLVTGPAARHIAADEAPKIVALSNQMPDRVAGCRPTCRVQVAPGSRTHDPERQRPLVEAEYAAFRVYVPTTGHHVYVLRDEQDQALYVGQSRTPRTRLRTHWRTQEWWPDVAAIELHRVDDELSARLLERAMADQLSPVYSVVSRVEDARLARMQGEG